MSWIIKMLSSTLGKKLLMSLTGLFLISFLTIHLIGNLAIFSNDNGLAFNTYAAFMSTNPLIGTVSYLLYAGIILHVVIAIILYFSNSSARPVKYKVQNAKENSTWSSRSMTLLGLLILAFILLHLKDFWWQYKHNGGYQFVEDANGNKDIYILVIQQFKTTFALISYLVGLVALFLHLKHGFQSAFQTLGLEHKKYTPAIKAIGIAYAIIVPLAFATMPVYVYFFDV
ncbi:MAG: succinate dehydrogenase cytochrome b subunit [Cyclobacteriaceae bacterium]|nr:succinate dehydrogenase cytochrome b subunit [Cyclobacteriaceae bacterium]MCK5467605.1 succinate dehydrogenase cytochrome b subunit [Cyclobacteriaceae bacterium]